MPKMDDTTAETTNHVVPKELFALLRLLVTEGSRLVGVVAEGALKPLSLLIVAGTVVLIYALTPPARRDPDDFLGLLAAVTSSGWPVLALVEAMVIVLVVSLLGGALYVQHQHVKRLGDQLRERRVAADPDRLSSTDPSLLVDYARRAEEKHGASRNDGTGGTND